jgi:hypothetical protein
MQPDNLTLATGLMDDFAYRTGLAPGNESPKRYLWTDAFAVCTFLELGRLSDQDTYLDLACALVQQVHEVLGRHRPDNSRSGWISGLSDKEGRRHPTIGGLRIGKPRNERGPDEPLDERSEWDRDGQYYHYLTKWMQALDWTSRQTGKPEYLSWALELAQAAHRAFTYASGPGRPKGIYWKISIDLSRPLVPFMGQHDPVDGLVTCLQLYLNPRADRIPDAPELKRVIEDLSTMTAGIKLVSSDPLGVGGLLCNALQAGRIVAEGYTRQKDLPEMLVAASAKGFALYIQTGQHRLPASHRLAFRELGLSLGLRAVPRLREVYSARPEAFAHGSRLEKHLDSLMKQLPLAEDIEHFWSLPSSQQASTWREHQDINAVMLAASLVPDGFLGRGRQDRQGT